MTAVQFEQHDLRAIKMARRALDLFASALDENGGIRGAEVGLALDDLELLIGRMNAELKREAETRRNVFALDRWSRRA